MPSQHGLSDQMEEAAKEWFTAGPHDKVKFEIDLMVAAGPLGKQPLMHNTHTHADLLSSDRQYIFSFACQGS